VVALIIILAGVVIDSLFSASWALDDGLLLVAAAVITLVLLVTRGGGRSEASGSRPAAMFGNIPRRPLGFGHDRRDPAAWASVRE
jgi:hypothetical protein